MYEQTEDIGEIHCLLCGRYLADIAAGEGQPTRITRPRNSGARIRVQIKQGRIHCGHCGGRAFVEWDLLPSGQASRTAA